MIKKLAGFLAGITLSICLPIGTVLANTAVEVALPTFDVTLNGIQADSVQSQYPFLVYKDITYVPMTYHDARLLGLETKWTEANGLVINKAGVFDAAQGAQKYKPYTAEVKNAKGYQATIVEGKVAVAGKAINNTKEEYPLLMFRDVTYFPLTWRFAVDEFGWKYTFNAKSGLNITPISVSAPSISTGSGGKLSVTGNVVNIRANNNTDAEVVAKVQSGDVLTFTEKKDNWYQVTLSSGKVGWIAGWLAIEISSGSDSGTGGGSSSGSSSAGAPSIELDSSHQLKMAQSGNTTTLSVIGLTASGYTVSKNSDTAVTLKVTGGNFKPQAYPIEKYGVKSVAVTGQLVTVEFTNAITHSQQFKNGNELVITATATNSGSGAIQPPQITPPNNGGTTAPNALKLNHMVPSEAKTIAELTIGDGNDVKVSSSTSGRIVLTIANNTMGTFTATNNQIGPMTAISARNLSGNVVELTITLKNGAYCTMETINNNLLITAKSRNTVTSQGLQGKTIVLDPGHGGNDPGAIGRVLGVTDAEVGLNVCNVLKTLLETQGANVLMTRYDAKGYMTVGERAQYSNSVNADIFVSVHANAHETNTSAKGAQVYYYAPSSSLTLAAQKPIRTELAQVVSDGIKGQTGRTSGIYTKNLGVLRENNSPSILVETGFLSNAEDEALLASPEYINKLAMGIYQGLVQYVSVN